MIWALISCKPSCGHVLQSRTFRSTEDDENRTVFVILYFIGDRVCSTYRRPNTSPFDVATGLAIMWLRQGITLALAESFRFVATNHLTRRLTSLAALTPLTEVPHPTSNIRAIRYVHRSLFQVAQVVFHVLQVMIAGRL